MNKNIDNLKICYIGGGSRKWAWVFMKDLALEKEIGGTVHLYDIDMTAALDNEAIGNRLMAESNQEKWKFKAEGSLKNALENSDFVFISILPKDFREMAIDVHAPEKYGIYQPVGDTTGAGGIMRALRTVPMYEEIARAVKDHAPSAWVLNYTNPMSVCTRTLYRVFPEVRAFGCCHEVFGVQKLLREMLLAGGFAKKDEVRREDIRTNVVGINHFTWIDGASWKNRDLFPLYSDFVGKYFESGYAVDGGHWNDTMFTSGNRVKMDLFKRYGIMAAAGDRHLAEFCPPSWYLKSPEDAKSWHFSLTPVSWRVENRDTLKQKSADYKSGRDKMVPKDSGEEGIRQIKALLGFGDFLTNVNLPNKGQMPHVPCDAVVETNAFFSRDSVTPVITRGMPSALRSLVVQHVQNNEGIVDAAMNRSLEDAFRVFLNDPQIAPISRTDARKLFDEMTCGTLDDKSGYR